MRKRSIVGQSSRHILFRKRLSVGLLALLVLVLMSGGVFAFTSQDSITMTGTVNINMDVTPLLGPVGPSVVVSGIPDDEEPTDEDDYLLEDEPTKDDDYLPEEEPSNDNSDLHEDVPTVDDELSPEEPPATDGESSPDESPATENEPSTPEEFVSGSESEAPSASDNASY